VWITPMLGEYGTLEGLIGSIYHGRDEGLV